MITKEQLAKFIDYTLLKPDATKDSVIQLCEEAKKYEFYSVCINPNYVSVAAKNLKETDIKVCSVIGFPFGASPPEVKALEAEKAIKDGASEIDIVINIGALKSHDFELAKQDMVEVVKHARTFKEDVIIKVIIETGLLTYDEKKKACEIVFESGANFVKTSTGFNNSGATIQDVKLLKKEVGSDLKIKASGGIRTPGDAIKLIEAGADRIGTSSGVAILEQYNNESHSKYDKKKDYYVYFLCLINWQNPLKHQELEEIKNYMKKLGESSEIGDWIKINLGWKKKFGNTFSKSELGFYHSRLIFNFKLLKSPKTITEIRKIKEDLEEEIQNFCFEKGIIKIIKEKGARQPYLFTYPIFELNKRADFWKFMKEKPYSLQTTCFFTKLYDPKRIRLMRNVKIRISGAQIIASNMSKWFFNTLVNIIFHEGLYRQTRDENLCKTLNNKNIYSNLENRLEDFASRLMTIFHQYSSDHSRHNIQMIALSITIIGTILGILHLLDIKTIF